MPYEASQSSTMANRFAVHEPCLRNALPDILWPAHTEALQMSLATLGTKVRSTGHPTSRAASMAVQRWPTREERLAEGRALTRHVFLATLAAGGLIYAALLAFS